MKKGKALVAVIMGSTSDAHVMKEAVEILQDFAIPFEFKVVSAHRSPEFMQEYAKQAEGRGIQVIIAGAGGAAHLPGMVASMTVLPVIGVPVTTTRLMGLDSLLSVVQMPKGVPVATVAVDNAHNAGLLAVRLLALQSSRLTKALHKHQLKARTKVRRSQVTLRSFIKRK